MNLTRLILFLGKGELSFFDVSVESQRAFLESLNTPIDLVDRSYCQYKCQTLFTPFWKRFLQNIVAFFIVPLFLLVSLIKRFFNSPGKKIDAIGHFKTLPEIVPKSLNEKYEINNDHWAEDFSLNISDIIYILRIIFRYPLSFYLVLKCSMNVARYSYMIYTYHPRAIICHAEFSFTSSCLTDYCRMHNVKHIDVMHGEKLYFIRDSFFEYDECYIWDEHYKQLFIDMRAEPAQFIIHKPISLFFDSTHFKNDNAFAAVKYYLTYQTENELKTIVNCMERIKAKGLSIKYRPHPTFTNMVLLQKLVNDNEIEFNNQVGIVESLSNLHYAVGLYSTTLLQAYNARKKVIFDDVTYPVQYEKLKDLRYILISPKTQCTTMSSFLKTQI